MTVQVIHVYSQHTYYQVFVNFSILVPHFVYIQIRGSQNILIQQEKKKYDDFYFPNNYRRITIITNALGRSTKRSIGK